MSDGSSSISCVPESSGNFSTLFGYTDVAEWEAFITIATLTCIILIVIIGNVLVILSVFTYKPLRIVQNFFIISLAVADLTVAILVLPLNVLYSILGRWVFGIHVCKMWLTSDVMCCTASILNLCAIALDRFWAITDPINYAQKRTLKRVLVMIGFVWITSLIISSPPLLGWNDWPEPQVFHTVQVCKLTERKGYVIYSALGSFFIPLLIMTIVYIQIFIATKRRLRERAKASKISAISKNQSAAITGNNNTNFTPEDQDSVSSETNHNDQQQPHSQSSSERYQSSSKKPPTVSHKRNVLCSSSHLKPHVDRGDSFSGDNHTTPGTSSRPHPDVKAACETTVVIDEATGTGKTHLTRKTGVVYQFIEEKQRISLSKERRAARTLGIIMGVFVVCWLPFFLMYVIIPFCPSCCPSRRLINFITWLGYVNSALNPLIYTIFNVDYRRAFRKLLGIPSS